MLSTITASALVVMALAGFVALGVSAVRRDTDVDSYLAARDSQGPASVGLSFLAAGMGVWILFAPPQIGATVGVVALVGYALGAAAPFIVFALLGPRVRAVLPRGRSLGEFVRLRYGRAVQAWVVTVSAAYMFCFVVAELTAAGAVGAIVGGLDPRWVVAGVAAATLLYTTWGGLRASLVTDRWQAWLICALVAIGVAVAAGGSAGGRGDVSALTVITPLGLEVALTLVIAVTAANALHQGYWQRVWAARDARALRRGSWYGAAGSIPVVLAVGAFGVLAVAADVPLGDPVAPVFSLLGGLPAWLAGAVLVLAVALVASSVDTLETGFVSLVGAELPRLDLPAARVVTVALMLPAVLLAFQGYDILRLFLIADLLAAGIVVPMLAGLWPRATAAGALAGGMGGLVGALLPGAVAGGSLAAGITSATFPGAVPTLPPFLGALLGSAALTVGVSLLGRTRADLGALHSTAGGEGRAGR